MGLYGNIMTAPDGSIFTFDKIYYGYPSEDPQERINWLYEKANEDNVFVGRFIYIQETCEIFMKSIKNYIDEETGKTWTYEYIKIASLMFIKQLANAEKDDWISVYEDNGVLNILHRGPIVYQGYKKIDLIEETYEPNKYYYKFNDEYIVDISSEITPGRDYYKKIEEREDLVSFKLIDFSGEEVYEANKYFYLDEDGIYKRDSSESIVKNRQYYKIASTRGDLIEYLPIKVDEYDYESNKYYFLTEEGYYQLDASEDWNKERQYYIELNPSEKIFIPKIQYDKKGHIMKEITPITEQDDYTLVLNGGAFLNN